MDVDPSCGCILQSSQDTILERTVLRRQAMQLRVQPASTNEVTAQALAHNDT